MGVLITINESNEEERLSLFLSFIEGNMGTGKGAFFLWGWGGLFLERPFARHSRGPCDGESWGPRSALYHCQALGNEGCSRREGTKASAHRGKLRLQGWVTLPKVTPASLAAPLPRAQVEVQDLLVQILPNLVGHRMDGFLETPTPRQVPHCNHTGNFLLENRI